MHYIYIHYSLSRKSCFALSYANVFNAYRTIKCVICHFPYKVQTISWKLEQYHLFSFIYSISMKYIMLWLLKEKIFLFRNLFIKKWCASMFCTHFCRCLMNKSDRYIYFCCFIFFEVDIVVYLKFNSVRVTVYILISNNIGQPFKNSKLIANKSWFQFISMFVILTAWKQ